MAAGQSISRWTRVELAVAGALGILAGGSLVALAFITGPGERATLTSTTGAAAALGAVVIAAGIETLRRRHFLFAVGVPILLALGYLAYIVATRQWIAFGGVVGFGLVIVLVASGRGSFRD